MTFSADEYVDLTDEKTDAAFRVVLDSMIESTEEFIRDDKVHRWRDPDGRMPDRDALNHVWDLYMNVFRLDYRDG